jgi:hypothetical protein
MNLPPTTFEFTLPRGFVDEQGQLHRQGVMRLATAKDELAVQRDRPPSSIHSSLAMLSRVIIRLGTLTAITPEGLENLFSLDLAYLREFYNRVNQAGEAGIPVQCPHCQQDFKAELTLSGEF